MKKFSIKDLVKIIRAQPPEDSSLALRAASRGSFIGVSTDSRTIKTGDCFFAIAGDNFDGHNYINDAFTKGAVCAVVGRDIDSAGNCLLKVSDTIKALGDFAAKYRRIMNFKVVAITGSVGKTMTRQITYQILSRHFRTTTAPKNFNNNIGLPLTLLSAGPWDEVVVAELGSNHPGEIAQLTRIAQPDVAVVTNVHPAHLEGFGDLETIAQEKLAISEGLRTGGTFIINGDCDKLFEACRGKGTNFTSFGKSSRCDIQAQNIIITDAGCRFTIRNREVFLPLLGAGNVENALAAWAVCSRFEITIDDFVDAAKTLQPAAMRAELLQIGNLKVLSDCYNANPASMKNALGILSDLGTGKNARLVFICGDMAELGKQTQTWHAKLGAAVAHAKVQLLITVGKSAQIVAQSAKNAAEYDLQTKSFADTPSACNNLKKFIKDYDIVLVKGSRTNKLELAVEKLKELFS